jgi:hypothetical protein
LVILKQRPEAFVSDPQVIYPPGGVDQDHALPERRRVAVFFADQAIHSIIDQSASI